MIISVTDGLPCVNVPVLSNTIVFTLFAISRYFPPLNKMPFWAPFPVPIINAAGVAIPRAQGQAMIMTDTNARSEYVKPMLPAKYHPKAADVAMSITTGTKYFAI